MALSGSFQNLPVSGFGLYCTWSATQSVSGNYSDVTLSVYLKYNKLVCIARSDSTISINGETESYTSQAINDTTSGAKTVLLKTKTVRVNHNADGTKSGVALSAYWNFSGTYSGTYVGGITASDSVTLDTIDRTGMTVSLSVTNVTSNGLKINSSASATADFWQYSLDNGTSWNTLSSTAGTSASKTVTGLSPNTTYNVKVRARKASNQVYGTSSTVSVTTAGGAVVNSATNLTADASSVQVKLNVTVYNASYNYTVRIKNGSTVMLTLSGQSWSAGTANRVITLSSSDRTTLLTAMASIKSFTGTFEVITYNGSTQVGSASSATATVTTTAANSAPTLSGFTYADTYSTTTGMRSLMVSAVDVTDAIRNAVSDTAAMAEKERLEEIDAEIIQIQEKVLALHKEKQSMKVGSEDYAAKVKEFSSQMQALESERDTLQGSAVKYAEIRTWLAAFDENIMNGKNLTAKDSAIMRSLVDHIVCKDDGFEITLKCGVTMGQEYKK